MWEGTVRRRSKTEIKKPGDNYVVLKAEAKKSYGLVGVTRMERAKGEVCREGTGRAAQIDIEERASRNRFVKDYGSKSRSHKGWGDKQNSGTARETWNKTTKRKAKTQGDECCGDRRAERAPHR